MEQANIQPGMIARSSDGHKLGKIIDVRGDDVILEKGTFFPKDYAARRDDVTQVTDDGVYFKWGAEMVETNYDASYGQGSYARETQSPDWRDFGAGEEKTDSIPVREEQLIAEKKGMKEVGRVRIHKDVRTEEQHFTVPVRREEVTVERVQGSEAAAPAEGAFQERTETYPIGEEQVEITKRPVTKEEVRVKSHEVQEERPVSGEVRKEEVRVDEDQGRR